MTLLDDLKARFSRAQDRREELIQTLEEREETIRKRRELELQLEAEELALEVDALEAEFRHIVGTLPVLYFDFEQSARKHITPSISRSPNPAFGYTVQYDKLRRMYQEAGFGDYDVSFGLHLSHFNDKNVLSEEERAAKKPPAPNWLPRIIPPSSAPVQLSHQQMLGAAWSKTKEQAHVE